MKIVDTVAARFGADRETAAGLLRALLESPAHDRERLAGTAAVARDRVHGWRLRCLAILLLEHGLLRARDAGTPLVEALAAAGIPDERRFAADGRCDSGATPREPTAGAPPGQLSDPLANLERKLERGAYLHHRIRGARTRPEDLEAFVERSEQECRLALGRYLLSPAEVVARIESLVRTSPAGRPASRPRAERGDPEEDPGDERLELPSMPVYEAEICRRLLASDVIYWVGERTTPRRFSLVEYPLTTVVLVVKPPASDLEIEIKRAGLKGRHPITVVWARDGEAVAPSHRLQGGSSAGALGSEALNAERLARRFELIHGREAPISRVLAIRTVASVPTATGHAPLLDYLADKRLYGEGHERMQHEMGLCVEAFDRERQTAPAFSPSPRHRTTDFLRLAEPAQAVLVGTTSLRLDLLAAHLDGDGAAAYLAQIGEPATSEAIRRVLDDLLEEVLDHYEPPPHKPDDEESRAAAALAFNRAGADACFLALTEQIGELWGTLLALRGGSRAESFVARNVGLRRVWRNGRWRVEVLFMDHDNLEMPGRELEEIHPHKTLRRMAIDAMFICGDGQEIEPISELAHLARIYRVDAPTRAAGSRRLRATAHDSYRRSIDAIRSRPRLRRLHHPSFLDSLLDLDETVAIYRNSRTDGGGAPWQDAVKAHLVNKGRQLRIAADYLHGLEESQWFLDLHGDLFLDPAEVAAVRRASTDSDPMP